MLSPVKLNQTALFPGIYAWLHRVLQISSNSLRYYRMWIALPWFVVLVTGIIIQFWLGYRYNSNETTNVYLQFARGFSYTLLLLLCLLWLPVMRHGLAALWRSRWRAFLPLNQAKNIHRWLGHFIIATALIHGGCYLLYFNTLSTPFIDTVLGVEPDVVRAMKTTMYEFVSEDESIEDVYQWINNNMPKDDFYTTIQPIMKEDCSKCHSITSTMTYAIPSLPLSHYDDVQALSRSSIYSRQFRINICGIIMLLLCLPLWFTSLAFMRKRHHHIFQHTHRLGYVIALLALLHIPRYSWLIVPTTILSIEFILSHRFRIYKGHIAQLEKVNDTILRFTMPRPIGFHIQPGHYLQLRVPTLKRHEWHDFSLTGQRENSDRIVLKIKAMGDWTNNLFTLCCNTNSINIVVDIRGPFASPAAESVKNEQRLMIAGGIGITPFLGIMHSISLTGLAIDKFHLVWVLRDPKLLYWLKPFMTSSLMARGSIHIYLTQRETFNPPLWLRENILSEFSAIYQDRPDWKVLFNQVANDLDKPRCYICGPESMLEPVQALCKDKGWTLNVEQF